MKTWRSLTHREFSVRTAGWFTVLKPDGWFPALGLPRRFRDRTSQSVKTLDHAGNRETVNPPQIMVANAKDRRLVRPALIVLTAMMVTSALLWWTMHP